MASNHEIQRLRALRPAMNLRARMVQCVRAFFQERGFLEVETPIRIPHPALELHIDAEPSGEAYLRTSPELHMKRLIAAGYETIFQIGPCFRRGEFGRIHHPEYSMLEWYRANADYMTILADTRELIIGLARHVAGGTDIRYQGRPIDLGGSWMELTVEQAFTKFSNWNPVAHYDADRFHTDLVDRIEPALPTDRPAVLMDYPAEAAALARLKPGPSRVAERWELYIGGLELANTYSELTDPDAQQNRFASWAEARRKAGKETYPLDEHFMAALRAGLPPSGGAALGIDRLVMLFSDAASLDEVLPFR